jgi:alpha-galactosidase
MKSLFSFHTNRLIAVLCLLFISAGAMSWPKKVKLPPMGWEPWNIDHCGPLSNWDEAYYKKLADFFVSSGLKNMGYEYITFECHAHYRDSMGRFMPNLNKFPNGLKPVTDYVHSKGLKARAYTDAGKGKCGGCYEGDGSFGHYEDDARRWADYGFDGVKIDWCGGAAEKLDAQNQFMEFNKAMAKYNPEFNIEICTWGQGDPWNWGRDAGTFWRTGGDIDWVEGNVFTIGGSWKGLLRNIDANRHPDKNLVGPAKGWNYADMLLVGVPGGLNEIEERTQFSMWAIMASPLFLGNDVLNMPGYVKDIVMNREIIAIDQDPLGIQGDVIKEYNDDKLQVWLRELHDGSRAIAILNRGDNPTNANIKWSEINIPGTWQVRDLWEHSDKGKYAEQYTTEVPAHATVVLKLHK